MPDQPHAPMPARTQKILSVCCGAGPAFGLAGRCDLQALNAELTNGWRVVSMTGFPAGGTGSGAPHESYAWLVVVLEK